MTILTHQFFKKKKKKWGEAHIQTVPTWKNEEVKVVTPVSATTQPQSLAGLCASGLPPLASVKTHTNVFVPASFLV